ncbi:hypothetical protein V8G54_016879 [Vigna mungo]|uniref:dCMP deaminase n=1 Tax=Vigna mungo TaxID=3915 RepID=A0AAQ3S1Q7_VIGMU
MNYREATLVATATVIGAMASAVALRFFCRSQTRVKSSQNGTVSFPQDPFDPSKRKGYLSWDDYFMAIAFLSAERSKDPNRQVGACLVSQDGIILGIGYNGFPRGCSDDKLPWAKKSPCFRNPGLGILWRQSTRKCVLMRWILLCTESSVWLDNVLAQVIYLFIIIIIIKQVNAILNTNHASAAGQRLYVTMFPCNECAKIIIQVGNLVLLDV